MTSVKILRFRTVRIALHHVDAEPDDELGCKR